MNENNLERPSYYAIIPAGVRYSTKITANAKLLYAEITALSNKSGSCWASNEYFADLYGVQKRAVSDWVKQLEDAGFVSVKITDNVHRRISVIATHVKNHMGGSENSLHNTKTNIVPKGTSREVEKKLISLVNKITGRNFRALPERGVKKTLDTFSFDEIESALRALVADTWHYPKLKEFKIDYFIRATTIDKFLEASKKNPAAAPGAATGEKIVRDDENGVVYMGGEKVTIANQDEMVKRRMAD